MGSKYAEYKIIGRIGIIFIFIHVATLFSFSQGKNFKPVADIEKFKIQYEKEASKVWSVQSSFSQLKKITSVTEDLNSEGSFYFKKPDMIKMEYTKPYSYKVVMNGSQITIQDGQRTNKVNAATSKVWKQMNTLMINSLQGKLFNDQNVVYTVFEADQQYKIVLSPKTKSMTKFLKNMNLYLRKSDCAVSSIEMIEPSGDMTRMKFHSLKINSQLKDEIFRL